MLNLKRLPALLAATALTTAMMTTVAAVPANAQSLEDMKAQLSMLAKRIEELEAKEKERDAKAKKTPVVSKEEPAFGLATDDGLFEFNIRGRILADATWASDDDDTMNTSATEFRAVRLGIEGKAWQNVGYKFEADFAGNVVTMKDAYLEYKSEFGSWKFGQFNPPVSLEELSSSRHTTFMERSSFTDAFNFERMLGVGYGNHGKVWTFNAGVFRGDAGSALKDEGLTVAARATYGGTLEDGVWMLGASVKHTDVGDGDLIRYRQRPHQHLTDRFLATSRIAQEEMFYGLEAAMQYGPFHVASEWGFVNAKDGGTAGQDAHFNGGYIEAGWFITGEHKPLKLDHGVWDRPKVNNPLNKGGMGAWQIAARYDTIDLSDAGVFGGEQDTYLLGVNWYMNRHTRFMVNYNHSNIDNAFDVSANGADGANSVDALGVRAQIDW